MLASFDKVVDESRQMQQQQSVPNNNSEADIRFTALLQRKRSAAPPAPTNTQNANYPQPWFPASMESLDITDVQALELARQVSLHQSTLFAVIHPREYLQYCAERAGAKGSCWMVAEGSNGSNGSSGSDSNMSMGAEEVAPNLHAFARWSKALGRLVASDIVKHEIKHKRVASLEKWIDVANHCLQLRNFDAVFNIMDGIRHPSIERYG